MLLVILCVLLFYSVGIALTVATFFMCRYLKRALYNNDIPKNRTTSFNLKFVAYISLFATAPSIFVYSYAQPAVSELTKSLSAPEAAFISILQVIIYLADIVLKIICYYLAINAIFRANDI